MSDETHFKCALCGGIFDNEWSDEVANAETERIFGIKDASKRDDMAVVCDGCFEMLRPRWERSNN